MISLLLKRSRGVGTGVRYADQQSLKIETDEIALQDGTMSSLVKLLLKQQGGEKKAAAKKQLNGRLPEAFSMVDHTPRPRRLTKREEELVRSKDNSESTAATPEGFAVGASQRAPEIAAADIPVAAMEVKWEVIYVSDNPRQTSKSSIYFGWR